MAESPKWREAIHGKPVSFNAFKLKRARAFIEEAGIEVGKAARITWRFDNGGLGSGVECSHQGPVSFYDGEWIELQPTTQSPGHLRLPIVALTGGVVIELVDELVESALEDAEDGGDPPAAPENPFIKKHLQKGSTNGE